MGLADFNWVDRVDGVSDQTAEDVNILAEEIKGHYAENVLDHKDGCVTTSKLEDEAVTMAKLAGNSVGNSQLANGAVTSDKIMNGQVQTAKLSDGAVTTAKLDDGSVTTAKLGNDVTSSMTYNRVTAESALALAKGANQAKSFQSYQELVNHLNSSGENDYKTGQNMMIVQLDVPDLWISQIVEEPDTPQTYEYTTDEDFLYDMAAGGGKLKIRYYYVSQLETQKVDLTNYYTKQQSDTLISALSSRVSAIERTVTTDTTSTSATLSAVAGNDYVYTQELTSLSISFGQGSHGDLINVAFHSGTTATTLTLSGNNYTTDISAIDASSIIEISAKYVIDRWVVWAKGTAIT